MPSRSRANTRPHPRQTGTLAQLRSIALTVARKLGAGHREAVYQRAFVVELSNRGIPSQTEVPVPFFLRGMCVGHGRADIVTKSHIIELKSRKGTPAILRGARLQVQRYLAAMHKAGGRRRRGVLIFFDPDTASALVETA